MKQRGCSEEGGRFSLASFTLTILSLWVTATGERDLLGASGTPRGFCMGQLINPLPVSGAHVVPQREDSGSGTSSELAQLSVTAPGSLVFKPRGAADTFFFPCNRLFQINWDFGPQPASSCCSRPEISGSGAVFSLT